MSGASSSRFFSTALPVILAAAVVQGWALYGLHHAIDGLHWPATETAWLLALYAVVIFVPLTVQLLADHVRQAPLWIIVAAMAVLFFYFGWHHGANVLDRNADSFARSGDWFPMAFVLAVLWLLLLPFIQCRLAEGHWRIRYQGLFATAWRNKLTLAEGALFTGLFWLLLFLWQKLFDMIGIGFFEDLFEAPIFVYPVTSLTFGFALYLIGSLERLTSVVLQQILNVLKWLAIVAGLILALFTVALAFRLPGMIASGDRAISAAWLLWLVAVTVLLVNAAYRDGSVEQPYPKWLAFALRCVIPLIAVIAVTALYALYVRIDFYGFTVARVWACIVAAAGGIYAAGYALAAVNRGRWMEGLERINIVTALFLIAVVSLALTPVLSPYRISANSQFAHAQEPPRPAIPGRGREVTAFHYLRFSAGAYGAAKLQELAQLQNHPRAAAIRADAAATIAQKLPWEQPPLLDLPQRLAAAAIYPAGRVIDPALRSRLEADLQKSPLQATLGDPNMDPGRRIAGVFADLNADQVEDFVLIVAPVAYAYELRSGAWRPVGTLNTNRVYGEDFSALVRAGDVAVQEPVWRELRIGRHRFRMNN